jgi:hypothetical protein
MVPHVSLPLTTKVGFLGLWNYNTKPQNTDKTVVQKDKKNPLQWRNN